MLKIIKNLIYLVNISLIIILFSSCSPKDKSKNDTYSSTLKDFQNPPAEYSTAPFWVWNYIITKPMIDEQLKMYKEIGVNLVIIHPRPGLVTEYLSKEWFDLIKYSVEVAKKLDMKIMLYDENSYPSGFAGGHVPAELPEVMVKHLFLQKTTRPDTLTDKFITLQKNGEEFKVIDDSNYLKDTLYYVIHFQKVEKNSWFAGYTYVDVLQKKTTLKFLEVTHEQYKKAIGDEFGKTVLGIFTDEPMPDFSQLPYSPGMFDEFQKRYGYDLKTRLPLLLEEIGDYRKVRHDTYTLLLDMFVEAWAKPYSEWCEKNKLPMTGHYWEHAWGYHAACPDNMAMNSYSQIPGIDVLCNNFKNAFNSQFGNDMMVRETKSVANQMGRSRLLSETYGAAGWDLTFQDMKRIGDWEYALGVNLMNQHLTWSSITGYRKYDHPPSFSYHAPYFKNYKLLSDYYSRLSASLSKGTQNNKVLLLEPTTSVRLYWKHYVNNSNWKFIDSMMMTCMNAFYKITHEFESWQVEYDIGSEYLIREYGKVDGNTLSINKGNYSLFILPPYTENLESKTVDLLEKYLKNGGKVLSTKILPEYIDGVQTNKIKNLAQSYKQNWITTESITSVEINNLCQPSIVFNITKGSDKLYHLRKELSDAQLIFISNVSATDSATGGFNINGGSVEMWDAFNGSVAAYPFNTNKETLTIRFDLPPAGSLLLCIKNEKSEPTKRPELISKKIEFSDQVKIDRLSPNMLIIDFCDLRLRGETFKDMYFYDAQKKVFSAYGFRSNPWQGIQYKTLVLDTNKFDINSGFEVDYKLMIDRDVNLSSVQAVYERPEIFKLKINGNFVEPIKDRWFIDKNFAVYDISKYLRNGANIVTIVSHPMNVLSELDRLYILGDFNLQSQAIGFKLISSKPPQIGDWTKQGMQLYADKVSYEHSINFNDKNGNYFIKLPEWKGACSEVYINEKYAGIIAFDPFELDITNHLNIGQNRIKVIVISTLRNLLGPHHTNDAVGQTWPSHFFSVNKNQGFTLAGDSYFVIPYGLMKDFELINKR